MTRPSTEICMRVPLSGGRFCIVIFDPVGPADFAPLLELNVAGMAQPTAPLFLKPLKENGAGAPLLHSAPTSSQEWRNTSPSGEFLGPKKTLQEEIDNARDILASKASDMAALDTKLAPVREEERLVRDAILATHRRTGGIVILNLDRTGERAPLFDKLTRISKEWGPLKSRRSRLNSEIRDLERQIERLQKLAATAAQKKRKA